MNGTGINVEGVKWILDKLNKRLKHQLDIIIADENLYTQAKYSRFMWGLKDKLKEGEIKALEFILNFDYNLSSNKNSQLTRGSTGDIDNFEMNKIYISLIIALGITEPIYGRLKDIIFDDYYDLDSFEDDDKDGLPNYLEEAFLPTNNVIDFDTDDVNDHHEFRVLFRTNIPFGKYNSIDPTDTEYFIAYQSRDIGKLYSGRQLTHYQLKKSYLGFDDLEKGEGLSFFITDIIKLMIKSNKVNFYSIENYPIILYDDNKYMYVVSGLLISVFQEANANVPNDELFKRMSPYPSIGSDYSEMVIQYTDPTEPDTDEDGLNDNYELIEKLSTDEIKVWNSIPTSEEPSPIFKDIYVEVDWMENSYVEQIIAHWKEWHKMSNIAKFKVRYAFLQQGIFLHIDDGTGDWSGGTSVDHYKDYLYWSPKDDNDGSGLSGAGPFNDYYDVKSEHFDKSPNGISSNRDGIFHYCLFGHHYSKWADGQEREGKYGGAAGTGWSNGAHFFLGDKRIHEINPNHVSGQQANTFMHELGHTLGLEDYDGGSGSSMGGAPSTKVGYGTAWGALDLDLYI